MIPEILIVDDDAMTAGILQKRIAKKGYNCSVVGSGEECLDILLKRRFDTILLDIMMPGLSGIDVLLKIRKTANNFELPVIMFTAVEEANDLIDALRNGANDYLTKPVNVDIAVARINTQLNLKGLFEDSLKNKQIATINTMVTTLNHEINNPLAIAIGNLTIARNQLDLDKVNKALGALDRITDIVKKIEKISNGEMEEVSYSTSINMYKI